MGAKGYSREHRFEFFRSLGLSGLLEGDMFYRKNPAQ